MSVPEPPPDIALAVRRQEGALRTLRAEGLVLPLLLLLLILGSLALDGGARTGVAVLLAIVPVPLVAAILIRLDRFEPEPTRLLVRTFLWGAGAATFIAIVINSAVEAVAGSDVAAIASAPVVEESAKALALIFVIRRRPGFLDGVHDGIVYAAWVALGFATVENVEYYARAALDGGWGEMTATFALRGLMVPLCHPLFTAMTGIGLGVAIWRGWGRGGLIAGFAVGLLCAMALHALWNASTVVGAEAAAYALGYLPLAAIGIALMIGGARRQRRILRIGLASEVAAGTISSAEYALLVSRGRARARLRRRARRAGRDVRVLVHQYETAAYELAHANAVGPRRGRPDREGNAAAYRACLADARRRLLHDAPAVLSSG